MFHIVRVLHRVLLTAIAGCALCASHAQWLSADEHGQSRSVYVLAAVPWSDSEVDVTAGDAISISADGSISAGKSAKGNYDDPTVVGPEGTYLYSEKIGKNEFPMASAASGPTPCYSLIGRIGDSQPFYIGRSLSFKPASSGRLYLGINDFDTTDNKGTFFVNIAKTPAVRPVLYEDFVPVDTAPGTPAAGCSVVVFYLDGLRPDVVKEMAAMGHIPNINRLFIEGGAWMSNAFTGFPSDTITSNGTMWTGCFSDRHGLKGQISFSRRTLNSRSYLDVLGPSHSARLLAPEGLDKLMHEAGAASVQVLDGAEASRRFRQRQSSGIPPLYEHLRKNGSDWSIGALPVMTDFPPTPWSRSLTKFVPYLQFHESWRYMDEANTDYAKNFLFERNSPVTIIWLPETDSVSHHTFSRGQFGATRRTIARADILIGQMVSEIEARRRFDRTYFILCSDHGHHGGRTTRLSHFDVADEFFYKPRLVAPDGTWIGGGLGLSVRQHRFWNRHPEDKPVEFVWIDADSDGAARVFLPNRSFRSGVWYGKPRPGDLLAYRIDDKIAPINLIESLTATQAVHGDGSTQHPVDLLLVKLTDDSILISTHERGNAVIHRKRNEQAKWVYKYTVVDRLQPNGDGGIAYQEVPAPEKDPLELIGHLHPRLLTYYHDETHWLRMTATSKYPDSIVALTRHMLWQENLEELERESAPDLVLTARSGWFFGTSKSPGTTHGYPFSDSMRASFFISGPNVRRSARIEEPCRLADLTPTMLAMIGYDVDTGDFDGHPLLNVFQSVPSVQTVAAEAVGATQLAAAGEPQTKHVAHHDVDVPETRPVFWNNIDLKAWKAIPAVDLPNYEHMPWTVHHPEKPFDISNVACDLLSISDINVLGLIDSALSPLDNGRPIIRHTVEKGEGLMRRSRLPGVVDTEDVLDPSTTTIGDYNFMSLGNIKRASGAIDWIQHRLGAVDDRVANQMGRDKLPGAKGFNYVVDGVQWWFWDAYQFGERVAVEWLDERLFHSIEDNIDRGINSFRLEPAQMTVDPSQLPKSPQPAANANAGSPR